MHTTHATVRNGDLVLDHKVDLPDATRVLLRLMPIESGDWRERLLRGVSKSRQLDESRLIHTDGQRFTRDQLHARG